MNLPSTALIIANYGNYLSFQVDTTQSSDMTPLSARRVLQTHPTSVAADFDITLDPGASRADALFLDSSSALFTP